MNGPLLFEPILKEKVWGGRSLETVLNKPLPAGRVIGESWEISGLPGNASRVTTDAGAASLDKIYSADPGALVGGLHPAPLFPLLYKFIDAQDRLSVQVHPDDVQARANGWGSFGKTECWYIVHADPGAQVISGFNRTVTADEVREALAQSRLTDLLNFLDIAPGDMILIHAGTVHANLKGTLLYEVQQTSDTTLRFYDWGRDDPSRPLHLEDSLRIVDMEYHDRHKIPAIVFEEKSGALHGFRAACRYFAVEEFAFSRDAEFLLPVKKSFRTLAVLSGNIVLKWQGATTTLGKGRSVLLPASLREVAIGGERNASFLLSSVPDIAAEIILPLRAAGIPDYRIGMLGGNPKRNDVLPMLR